MSGGRWLRRGAAAAFSAALLLGVAWLGQLPFGRTTGVATLRLALRATQGRAEICRDLSAAELAELPAHMRRPRVCEELAPPYRLRVAAGAQPLLEEQFRPGGLRGDRPLIVDRQLRLAAGTTELRIELEPILDPAARRALTGAAIELPGYRLERRVDLPPDRITLVLLDEATGRLRIYDDPAAAPGAGADPAP